MTERWAAALRALLHSLRDDLWTPAVTRPSRTRRLGGDWYPAILVPVLLAAFGLCIAGANSFMIRYGMSYPLGLPLAILQASVLVVALSRPHLAWWLSLLTLLVAAPYSVHAGPALSGPFDIPTLLTQAVLLFLLALQVRLRVAAEMLAAFVLLDLLTGLLAHPGNGKPLLIFQIIATVLGAALHGRQEARNELVVQEELNAQERAQRTLLEERSRIARELHDVVAHHMSVISVQAQVAVHLAENPSDELKESLAGIRGSAVDALAELRRVLGVLRAEDPSAETTRHAPQPTLARLDELFAKVRAAGLTVGTETTGRPLQLAPGVDLSAYRIVQEALSNAIRHAPGAAVRVELGYQAGGLTIRVVNSAPKRPAPPSPGSGHGLLGMRERIAMVGGELATGPTPDGGYEVTAVLPSTATPATDTLEDAL
ncbi:sensor histidine kinase [Kitasatospora acidiphila]|uniref:histidine kinase n=1 Tax=Kitasatospora acidiphila TaxID=2567942 RepID=A0A540W595_9ACTN|nr:sensor histidine kinase [Kitasatospora acidiphila]TQF04198.1 sensor histidine kinase [Kitasatospora acidiphila]